MMRNRITALGTRVLVLALLASVPATSLTAQDIDQQNTARVGPFQYAQYWIGQTFQPTATTVAGAGLFLQNYNSSISSVGGLLTAELWTGRPDVAGNTMLASATSAFITPAGQFSGAFADVFWPAVSVTPGQQYFLAFATDATDYYVVNNYSYDSYSGGSMQYSSGTDHGPWADYGSYGYDLTFREFAATVAPEPASLVLLGTGLLGVAGVVRRKRRV